MLDNPLVSVRFEQQITGTGVHIHRAYLSYVAYAWQRKYNGHTPGNPLTLDY